MVEAVGRVFVGQVDSLGVDLALDHPSTLLLKAFDLFFSFCV